MDDGGQPTITDLPPLLFEEREIGGGGVLLPVALEITSNLDWSDGGRRQSTSTPFSILSLQIYNDRDLMPVTTAQGGHRHLWDS
ncbi:hypothetical protein CRG98_001461 [Punica granatum]|uniref:Uncharacterized protein n=1 Tax=Punica granatum TaxID=22663 RepID=A0A2I0LBS0_PUNGR|nr:hypothetical protein CRG98_001461 [Punica granatum]